MKCNKKRTVFDLFNVYTCDDCPRRREDELIVIGRQAIAVYYLGDDCPHLDKDDYALSASAKLRLLLKDAVAYDDQIMLFVFDRLEMRAYYDLFESILDDGLSVQVILLD
ncbi:MAG TPA: hypothetical protein GX390_02320 [Acholeplasmataceae bacterium]|jgi:hypothetical protein|nr:hypothetical protein [Acholeplasmataceae bacterium]